MHTYYPDRNSYLKAGVKVIDSTPLTSENIITQKSICEILTHEQEEIIYRKPALLGH